MLCVSLTHNHWEKSVSHSTQECLGTNTKPAASEHIKIESLMYGGAWWWILAAHWLFWWWNVKSNLLVNCLPLLPCFYISVKNHQKAKPVELHSLSSAGSAMWQSTPSVPFPPPFSTISKFRAVFQAISPPDHIIYWFIYFCKCRK